MSTLANELIARFGEAAVQVAQPRGEITLEVQASEWLATCTALRDEFGFDTFTDLCGIDYLGYGDDEWDVEGVSAEGFSRGVEGKGPGRFAWGEQPSHQVPQPGTDAPDADLQGRRYLSVYLPQDRPGSLRALLEVFERLGVNLGSIHSSRTPDGELHFRIGLDRLPVSLALLRAEVEDAGIGRVLEARDDA